MKKYITTKNKEVVNLGDIVITEDSGTSEHGKFYTREDITVTEESIPYLLENRIIEEVQELSKEELAVKIIDKLSKFLGGTDSAIEFLGTVYDINETAFRNIIYKKVAVELDKKYKDHIKDCDYLWTISSADKSIHYLYSSVRVNMDYKNIALFREKEDAQMAKDVADTIISFFEESDE